MVAKRMENSDSGTTLEFFLPQARKMVKQLILLTYVSLCVGGLNAVLYDCVSGKPVTKTQLRIYKQRNNTGVCTVEVKPCDPEEWQRVDGSCYNPKYPSRGTQRTPTIGMLPVDFEPNYEPRKAVDGSDLELPRRLRTALLTSGKASDLRITQLLSYFLLFSTSDINSVHDVFTVASQKENMTTCVTPVKVPRDDPVHRFSGISCLNLTRPQSYQTYGCLDHGTEFVRIVFQTPMFDLSSTYNPSAGNIDELGTFKDGLLKTEKENGKIFPPSGSNLCFLNEPPRETRCNKYHANTAVGPILFFILFYEQHNEIAKELHKLNPSWNDERLFYTARDINIAIFLQIFFYEMMPIFLATFEPQKRIPKENHVKGGRVPKTMYCLMVKQLKRSIASNKHWYERPNRPHAFTKDQLKAIRKVTIAGVLCTIVDAVTEIQPHAFYTISSKNPLTKCSSCKIGTLDLTPWKE